MTPAEEFLSRMERLIAKNEALFAAAVADFRAQYLEAFELTLSKRYTLDYTPIFPVYVNGTPYVPKSELDQVRSAFADCVVMTDDCRMIIGFETPDKCAAAALTLSEVVG